MTGTDVRVTGADVRVTGTDVRVEGATIAVGGVGAQVACPSDCGRRRGRRGHRVK